MHNVFATVTAVAPKTSNKKEDILDVLLKLNHTEREAVMAELKRGEKVIDNVQAVYDRKATSVKCNTLSFYC